MNERITLGDGRRAQMRALDNGHIVVTYGRGEGSELFRAGGNGLEAARRAVTEWARSLKPAPPLPPVLDVIERARELARDVARLDEIEGEARVLRERIAAALS